MCVLEIACKLIDRVGPPTASGYPRPKVRLACACIARSCDLRN